MSTRSCCRCGAVKLLKRARWAQCAGGPAQWECAYGCAEVIP